MTRLDTICRNTFAVWIILLGIGLALYANTMANVSFHGDDVGTILQNSRIRDITNIGEIWSAFNTRFAVGLSFALNYCLSKLTPQGYRLVNILLHIINACLVYRLAILLATGAHRANTHDDHPVFMIGMFAALIYLVHPIQTEAVNLITQRYVLMATLFYLLTVIFYLNYRLAKSRLSYLAALGTMILAMYSKEIAFTLPFILVLLEGLFFGLGNAKNQRKQWMRLLPFLIGLVLIPMTLLKTSSQTLPTAKIAAVSQDNQIDITQAGYTDIGRSDYFFTQINVVRTYFRLLIFPVYQNFDYDYPLSSSLLEWPTRFSFLLLIFVLGLGFLSLKSDKSVSFLIFWFFITLSIESSFIPIAHVIAEYRLYLPAVGVSILIAYFCFKLTRTRKTGVFVCLIMVGLLSVATIKRNFIWQDDLRLWQDVIHKSPNKSRGYNNLGQAYAKRGEYNKALRNLEKAIKLNPQDYVALTNLGTLYRKNKNLLQSSAYFQAALDQNPSYIFAHVGLGYNYYIKRNYSQARKFYERAAAINPYYDETYFLLGQLYADLGDTQAVADQIEVLRKLNRSDLMQSLQNYIQK